MKQCAQSIHDHTLVSLAKLNFETAICEQHALFTQKNDPTLGPGILAYLTEHYSPINSCVHVNVGGTICNGKSIFLSTAGFTNVVDTSTLPPHFFYLINAYSWVDKLKQLVDLNSVKKHNPYVDRHLVDVGQVTCLWDHSIEVTKWLPDQPSS